MASDRAGRVAGRLGKRFPSLISIYDGAAWFAVERAIRREVKRAVEEEREASAVRWREMVGASSEAASMWERDHGEAEAEDALDRLRAAIRGCVLR